MPFIFYKRPFVFYARKPKTLIHNELAFLLVNY